MRARDSFSGDDQGEEPSPCQADGVPLEISSATQGGEVFGGVSITSAARAADPGPRPVTADAPRFLS